MLIVLSPAKTLDYESPVQTKEYSIPAFLDESRQLVELLKTFEPHQISELMGISAKLGELNSGRYQSWQTPFNLDNAKQAILAFKGDVYTGLQAEDMSEDDLQFANETIIHLSGLYGLLKPLDLMQPYRLEMGAKLANGRGKDLYEFWGSEITDGLNKRLKEQDHPVLVNLASNEYFKSVQAKHIEARVVTPIFKDLKNGKYKIISFFAKKARGLMANYVVKNRLSDVEALKLFDVAGYRFNEAMTQGDNWVFTRDNAEG